MTHALIVVPLVVLLLELFMHPQVYRSQRELQQLSITALLSTSGCANAATGAPGLADQHDLAHALATALELLGQVGGVRGRHPPPPA